MVNRKVKEPEERKELQRKLCKRFGWRQGNMRLRRGLSYEQALEELCDMQFEEIKRLNTLLDSQNPSHTN